MKKFRISVNGNSYEVEVEELDGNSTTASPAPVQKSPAPVAKKPKKAAPTKKPQKSTPPVAGGHKVESPMPGTILSINVAEGDSVSNGDVLLVLEAMKMENEITSEVDGTIVSINIENGAAVDAGEVLVVIE
jgi:biotin carboxyl carrier protein